MAEESEKIQFRQPEKSVSTTQIEGTVVIPNQDREYPKQLMSQVISRYDDKGGTAAFEVPIFEEIQDGILEIKVDMLAYLMWEHRQYSKAQGFSPRQMEILRAIQLVSKGNPETPVFYDQIKDQADFEVNDSTLSSAVSTLVERKLISRHESKDGVVYYRGFDSWVPDDDEKEGSKEMA